MSLSELFRLFNVLMYRDCELIVVSLSWTQSNRKSLTQGSKWTLTSLWKYFRAIGVETDPIWKKSILICISGHRDRK